MRKYLVFLALGFIILSGSYKAYGQAKDFDRRGMIDSLNTIDPEVMRYFPRWKICETDLQVQIYRTFKLLGKNELNLDMKNIEVLAMPKIHAWDPYTLLLVTCGTESMNTTEIEINMSKLADYISGAVPFRSEIYPELPERDYCYQVIPPDIPVTKSQAFAIQNFMEPNNVDHALTLSLFDQTLKIGDTDFWLKSVIGTDPVGYPFWESGESRVLLKRPLINNDDMMTSKQIPQLLDIQLGYVYRMSSGIDKENTALNWVSGRRLNAPPGGKIALALDFHLPKHPLAGVHLNLEMPLADLNKKAIDEKDGGYYIDYPQDENLGLYDNPEINFLQHCNFPLGDPRDPATRKGIIPFLMETGQLTFFYNMWLGDQSNPENYLRFDLGLSYSEVDYYLAYSIDTSKGNAKTYVDRENISDMHTYKPKEFGDWLFAKVEYRSQSTYPFGFSAQYSNQIFLGRVYIPIFGDWFYLEAKYSTPLRPVRPYEIDNFFMISPVLRISI